MWCLTYVFQAVIVHNLSTSRHHQATPENVVSFNLRSPSWPYMEMLGKFCDAHVPQASEDVVQLEWTLLFH